MAYLNNSSMMKSRVGFAILAYYKLLIMISLSLECTGIAFFRTSNKICSPFTPNFTKVSHTIYLLTAPSFKYLYKIGNA